MSTDPRDPIIIRRPTTLQARPRLNIQRKVTAGVAVGALGTIAAWAIEAASGVPVPSYVALAIATVLVALVQYAVSNRSK